MNLTLCRDDGVYFAGRNLNLKWRIRRIDATQISGVELSVLWRTEGKGDEDLSVHHFQRLGRETLGAMDLEEDQSFECRLPVAPLSYHGTLITLCWCVRQRVFIEGRKELMIEVPFHLVVPPAVPSEEPLVETADDPVPSLSKSPRPASVRSWLPIKRRP